MKGNETIIEKQSSAGIKI